MMIQLIRCEHLHKILNTMITLVSGRLMTKDMGKVSYAKHLNAMQMKLFPLFLFEHYVFSHVKMIKYNDLV